MADAPLRTILVVGGGIAGWMMAGGLARALKERAPMIRLLDGPKLAAARGPLEAEEATLPAVRGLHAILGVDEAELMGKTDATYRLGAELNGFAGPGRSFLHPLGEYGAGMDGVGFHHYWLRARAHGDETPLEDYALAAVAARLGKFARPSPDPASVLSTLSYALHLDAALYERFLRGYAEARGVGRIEGDVGEARLRGADGFIEAIALEDGRLVEADFFIDCTGAGAALIEGALGVGFEDWSAWLPCDRIVAASGPAGEDETPLTRLTAHEAGYDWRIPLQHRVGAGLVFANDHLAEDAGAEAMDRAVGGAEPRLQRFTPGRRKRFWRKNCLAVGAAACVFDPMQATGVHLVQSALARFVGLMPDRSCGAGEAEEYERIAGVEIERIRDFAVLHYKANGRSDPFWRACAAITVPDSLAHRLEQFQSRGRIFIEDEETFLESSWISALIGLGVTPRRFDPLVEQTPLAAAAARLGRMRAVIRQAAEAMSGHRVFLAHHCAAPAPTAAS